MRDFCEDLKKCGPHSKQILNYSYPPLLYQRGEDDEEDEEEEGDLDPDEDADIMELINGKGQHENGSDQLLKQLQNDIDDGNQFFYEQVDENGNVYLMGEDEEHDPQMQADFAAQQRNGRHGDEDQEHNSTIINSSQNTSLEEGFKQFEGQGDQSDG